MPLTDLACRKAKPLNKPHKLSDSGGLFLMVLPTGKKVWRYKYRFHGKEKLLTIGSYPEISISSARQQRDLAKEQIRQEIDPAEKKQEDKKLAQYKSVQTFELVATEWHQRYADTWSEGYAAHVISSLKMHVFPSVGSLPISKITTQHILSCLKKMEEKKRFESARRVLGVIGQIMRYGVQSNRIEHDITPNLKGALKKHKRGHFAAISIDQLPKLVRALNKNEKRLFPQTIRATKLLMLTLARTKELINAPWDEFDLDKAMWSIPAERMKMGIAHVVPLSKQAVEILKEEKEAHGDTGFVFPSIVRSDKPISNNTILKALGRLGYHKKMTGHGFRALGMSAIKEQLGYRHEVVDRQLAHLPKSQVDQAYDRATFLFERKEMMQKWADYIDEISK